MLNWNFRKLQFIFFFNYKYLLLFSHLVISVYWSISISPYNDSIQFSCSIMSNSLRPQEPQHVSSLSNTKSQGPPKPMSIELVMPSNHLILCHPLLSCLQSFPASGSFQMSQPFASGGQNIGVSASTSVLPMNTQD